MNEAAVATEATRWLDRFFAAYYAARPVNASFVGVHDHDARLPDFSESGAGAVLAEMKSLLRESEALTTESLADSQRLDVRLARGYLRTQIWEYGSDHFHRGNPSTHAGEAVFGVLSLFLAEFAPLSERIAAATARLEAIPSFLGHACRLREAPLEWTERAIRECAGGVAFCTDGVANLLADNDRVAAPGFEAAARRAAAAFASFRSHLESELRGRPIDRYACGEEALSLYLREGHCLAESADEIARHAESELRAAEAFLAAHASDFSGGRPEHAPAGLYLARYQELWDAARDVARTQDLLTWPDFPIRYRPRPPWARAAAPHLYFLFYRSPAAFGRPPVHDYLVTPIDDAMPRDERDRLLAAHNDSVIKLNHVVHHGGIGHHVQNYHAFRAASRIGRIAAVDCASRIALFCGGTMAEGWACYATDLMNEAGFLTPLEQYAEHQGRARMCARAVVDVRLHQGRMSLEDAARYYVEHAGMSGEAARAEAVKNSMFPGAAVMYVMGRDAIHRLRREISALDGERFSRRAFHDEFLSYGSLPVSLIAEAMKAKRQHAE